MDTPYTLTGSAVHVDGRTTLTFQEVATFMSRAVRRKLRKRGHITEFLTELRRGGGADYGWHYTRSTRSSDGRHYVHVTAKRDGDGYVLLCRGPQAAYTVARVSRALRKSTERAAFSERKDAPKKQHRKRSAVKKRERLQKAQAARALAPKQTKKRRPDATMRTSRIEKLTPQFKNQRLFWDEAAHAVMHIFGVKGDSKSSALQVATRELRRSLEHTNGRFATYSREGFTLQFEVVDGRWRGGEMTPILISATKDNRHVLYRRMRRYFKDRFISCGGEAQRLRHHKLHVALTLPSNVIVANGMRFAA